MIKILTVNFAYSLFDIGNINDEVCCNSCFVGHDSSGRWTDTCEETCSPYSERFGDDDLVGVNVVLPSAFPEKMETNLEFRNACGCGDGSTGPSRRVGGFIELNRNRVHCDTLCWIADEFASALYDRVNLA